MIDYEKLKITHELGQLLSNKTGMRVDISLVFMDEDNPGYLFIDYTNGREQLFELNEIDLLINDLKILTEPKPKYKVGDKVWFVDAILGMREEIITEINVPHYKVENDYWVHENEKDLYPTKQALIEAQIEYWRDQLCDELDQYISPSCYPPHKEKECPNCHQLIFREPCPCRHKPAAIPFHRCQHGVICYETEKVSMYCEICGNKPTEEECQHESQTPNADYDVHMCVKCFEEFVIHPEQKCQHEDDGNLYRNYLAMCKCIKCGEFYK